MSSLPAIAPLLSELQRGLTRRNFLTRTAVAGSLLASACRPGEQQAGVGAGVDTTTRPRSFNSSSREDTLLGLDTLHTMPMGGISSDQAAPYRRYDPALPPLSSERTLRVNWRAQELPLRIDATTVVAAWTFEGDIPGPVIHCRQGDTIEFTLTNEGDVPHSMDFHAAQINPRTAFRSVPKGESVTFSFQPRYAGAFMYHCGTAPVLMHIGNGMYGALIVSPSEPLPQAREFVLVQSEYYLGAASNGVIAFDFGKMMGTGMPDYVCFNGRPNQYVNEPIRVKRGERVRFWVVAAGPSHDCRFHIVGEQFERVYIGAPPRSYIEGIQTYAVPSGGGMAFEFVADIEGEFPIVNHGFGHGQMGGIGFLVVEP
jgi:nitrite reductase (NO-forming)